MNKRLPLRVVDARNLPESYRRLLAPEEPVSNLGCAGCSG